MIFQITILLFCEDASRQIKLGDHVFETLALYCDNLNLLSTLTLFTIINHN